MTRSLWLLCMLALVGAGCAARRDQPGAGDGRAASLPSYIELDERRKPGARSEVTLAPTSGEPLAVYTLRDLPEGFVVGPDGNSVRAEKDFPTAQAPHRVIALVAGLGSLLARQTQAELAAQLTDFVKARGGNALVFRGAEAQVLAVSSAPPVYPTAADAWPSMDAAFAMDKYVPGETVALALDTATPTQVKLNRRECIGAAVALEPAAKFSTRGGAWRFTTGAPSAERLLVQGRFGGASRDRTIRTFLLCTSKPTTVPLMLSSVKGGPIGTGPAKLRIYRLRPSAATVDAECARCSAWLRTQASSSKSDMSKCLPSSLTPDICD